MGLGDKRYIMHTTTLDGTIGFSRLRFYSTVSSEVDAAVRDDAERSEPRGPDRRPALGRGRWAVRRLGATPAAWRSSSQGSRPCRKGRSRICRAGFALSKSRCAPSARRIDPRSNVNRRRAS